VFSIEFLHVIREFEYKVIAKRLFPGARILEIGGGTGYQARQLAADGYDVASIDVMDSVYLDKQDFPVQVYDGRNFPFPDASFDIVFSSNVLEHVKDLAQMHAETARVLKPGGYCVHVMPTGVWRFWTNVANYIELIQRLVLLALRLIPRTIHRGALSNARYALGEMIATIKQYAKVPRHGETGNAISEIFTFSTGHWARHFKGQGFVVEECGSIGLFYTGHLIFGAWLPIAMRNKVAGLLGSACYLYKVRPPKITPDNFSHNVIHNDLNN
jgi:ubiquinone/menaquinone biosynthesis C-methylase UbiE